MIEEFDDKKLQSFEYETTILNEKELIGSCEIGKATIQLLNDDNQYSSLKGTWIKTIHGSLYIYEVNPVQERVNIKLDCYDIKYKLLEKYDSTTFEDIFPTTLKNWRDVIFEYLELEIDDADFPNSDLQLDEHPYVDSNSSFLDVVKQIAQAGCSFVITDTNDKFYFKWFSNILHTATDWIELTTLREEINPIVGIVLSRGDSNDNVYYPENLQKEDMKIRIDSNYILDPQDTTTSEDRRDIVKIPIYNRVHDLTYIPYNMRTQSINNKLSVNLGDNIEYNDIYENHLTSLIMSKKIVYLGGDPSDDDNYEITISCEQIKDSSEEFSKKVDLFKAIEDVSFKVDKEHGIIEGVVSKVNENSEQIATLNMTANNLSINFENVSNIVEIINSDYTTNEELENHVPKEIRTTTGFTFDSEGLALTKTGSPASSKLTEQALEIKDDSDNEILYVGYDKESRSSVTRTINLELNEVSRFQNFVDANGNQAVGCFWK